MGVNTQHRRAPKGRRLSPQCRERLRGEIDRDGLLPVAKHYRVAPSVLIRGVGGFHVLEGSAVLLGDDRPTEASP
jgi:hypothetical protein